MRVGLPTTRTGRPKGFEGSLAWNKSQFVELHDESVGATLVVARVGNCRLPEQRDGTSPSPTIAVPCTSARRRCRGGNFHGTNRQPIELRGNLVGATARPGGRVVVARLRPTHATGCPTRAGTSPAPTVAPHERPSVSPMFPARPRPGPRGRNSHGTDPQPGECIGQIVGATLVVARAGHDGCLENGRDKPVPYGRCDARRRSAVGATLWSTAQGRAVFALRGTSPSPTVSGITATAR